MATKSGIIPLGLVLWLCITGAAWPQDTTQGKIIQGTQNEPLQVQQGSRPVPDPTELTGRAIEALRKELSTLWDERFADLTKQIDRLSLDVKERPEDVRRDVATLKDLMDEKFKGVAEQFAGRDNSLDIAFNAQKDKVAEQNASNTTAANKSENAFKDQIGAISNRIEQQDKTTNDKIQELRDRVGSIDGKADGAAWLWALLGAVGGGIISFILAVAALKNAFKTEPAPIIQYVDAPPNGNGRKRA